MQRIESNEQIAYVDRMSDENILTVELQREHLRRISKEHEAKRAKRSVVCVNLADRSSR